MIREATIRDIKKVDLRIKKIAKLLVNFSCKIKNGDNVIIASDILAKPLAFEVYKECLLRKAYPRFKWNVDGSAFLFYKYAFREHLKHFPSAEMYEMKKANAIIILVAPKDKKELASIEPEKISLRKKTLEPLSRERLKKRWVIFVYPTAALAKDADMSLAEFKNFVFSSCLIDWKKLGKKLKKVERILDEGKNVRILTRDTDISFSIARRKAVVSIGEKNMPSGEVFTAPLENTVNGYIKFTYPCYIYGKKVSGIFLRFRKGKLVEAKARRNADKLMALIKTDEGASKIGEFGIGLNPYIKKFVNEILFDEKINGTIHLALGNAYKECKGTNKSAIHLDLIKDMRKGKIFIDSKLIYENGKFKKFK